MRTRILLLVGVLALWVSVFAQQPCMQGYTYRRSVQIANSSGLPQNDQLVEIKFDATALITGNKMLSNCTDIAFADENGSPLDYWIDEKNSKSNNQSVWVKLPTLAAAGQDIFMFYGNPSAFSRSDKTIFDGFEEFDNLADWTVCPGGSTNLTNGLVTLNANTVLVSNNTRNHNYAIDMYVSSISGINGSAISAGQYNKGANENGYALTYKPNDPAEGSFELNSINNSCAGILTNLAPGSQTSGSGVWSFEWNAENNEIAIVAPGHTMNNFVSDIDNTSAYTFIAVEGSATITIDWLIYRNLSDFDITATLSPTEEMINATTELSLSTNAPFCEGSQELLISTSFISGATYHWKHDNVEITGQTAHTLSIPAADAGNSGVYTVNVSIGTPECNTKTSDIKIAIDPQIVKGTISADAEVCQTSNQGVVQLQNYAGDISGWQYRINHSGLWYDLSTTSESLEYSNLSETHSFRARFESGTCGTGYSDSTVVTVSPSTHTGTISSDVTVCEGSTGNVSLSDYVGTITDWEISTDKNTFQSLGHTGNSWQYTLTDSAWYRAIVKNGVCDAEYTTTSLVAVNPHTVGGVVENGKYVCAGKMEQDTLFLNGSTGNVLRWEFGPTANGPWSESSIHENYFIYQGLANTSYYRALLESPGCNQQYAIIDTVIVDQLPEAGELVGATNVCASANAGYLELKNYSDRVIDWITSLDGDTWTPQSHRKDTLHYTNLQNSIFYRAIVNSRHKVCIPDTSEVAAIGVSQATIAGNLFSKQTVLCEVSNKDTIIVSGETGQIEFWESSPNGEAPWANIAITNDSLVFENLNSTTWYRAAVKSGACPQIKTTPIQIGINAQSKGGNVLGNTDVCELVNAGEMELINSTGKISQWEYSTDNLNWQTYPGNPGGKLSYNALTDTTYFRAIVKSGLCPYDTSTTGKVTVNPLPDVTFNVADLNAGESARFNNTTSIEGGFVMNWLWDFGDNESSASKNPLHTYLAEGAYHVRLTAFSNKGCVDSASTTVTVYGLPEVSFTAEDVCLFSETAFNNTSSNPAGTNFIWNFGDGSPERAEKNPVHTYAEAGDYTVTLKAVSGSGGIDSVKRTIYVYPRATPNFRFENICEGATATFANHTEPVHLDCTYEWDFGNGQTDTRTDPSVEYTNSGAYMVKMKSATLNGCVDSISKVITVNPRPQAAFTVEDVPYREKSVFVNQSTIMPLSSLTYHWEFGEGNTSDTANPVHIYETPAVYPVLLTATSGFGCVAKAEKQVTVFDLPVARFTFNDVCNGSSMYFKNESAIPSGTLSYLWSFGDGNTSTEISPKHLYNASGKYKVQLICISNNGARDTIIHEVGVFEVPEVSFNFNEACDGQQTLFENISQVSDGNIVELLWDFGDGTNSVQTNPVVEYLNPGTYPVTLEVTSSNECSNRITKQVIVHPRPVASFRANDVCFGVTTEFVNESVIDNTLQPYNLFYTWDFANGSGSVQEEPAHKYSEPGMYRVQLIAGTNANCQDTLNRYIKVFALPDAYAGEDTTVSKGFPISLQASGGDYYEWLPPTGLSDASISGPKARPMETTRYVVRVTDNHNCINYDSVNVVVKDEMRIVPSNILTPNNNGENDTWHIVNIDSYPEAELTIFDRWGKTVYVTSNYRNDWSGMNQNGDILPDGTYYYVIVLHGANNMTYKGAITILRDR